MPQKKDFKIYTYEEIRADPHKFEEVYDFIKMYGEHTISNITIQPEINYFVVEGVGFLAYKKQGKNTFVLGDTHCNISQIPLLLRIFLDQFENVCFLQANKITAKSLSQNHGYSINILGSETLIENEKEYSFPKDKKLEKTIKELSSLEKRKDKLYEKINSEKKRKEFWKVKTKVHKLRKKVRELEEEKRNCFINLFLSHNSRRFLRREHSIAKRKDLFVEEVYKLDEINLGKLEEISRNWLNQKATKEEMSFLLRPIEKEHLLKNHRRLFLLKDEKNLYGFAELTPLYKKREIYGYYADIVRVNTNSPPGSINFLLLEIMNKTFLEGRKLFSLGLSPFHKVTKIFDKENPKRRLDNRFVTFISKNLFKYGNFLYNARGQAFHKEKFRSKMQQTFFCTNKKLPISHIVGSFLVSKVNLKSQTKEAIKALF